MMEKEKIPAKLQETIDTLSLFQDRAERIEVLIGLADQFQPVPESVASRPYPEERRVKGCESEAYVFVTPLPDHTLKFHFAVENPQGISAMAMASILEKSLSGAPLDQILNIPQDIVYRIFGEELSMGKNLGLTGMVNMVGVEARNRLKELNG